MRKVVKCEVNQDTREKEILVNSLLSGKWYHSIELSKGIYTKGYDFDNVVLTRRLLKGCEVENTRCLDVGAMDCLISILLERRGATKVVAYERFQREEKRIDLLKSIMDLEFEYLCGSKIIDLPNKLRERGLLPFDLIVLSGVLYHVFDPLGTLALVRGMLRNGGLLVLETASIIDDKMAMYFNADGRFYPYTNYWQISVECLDYLLRFLRLQPLDCIHLKHHKDKFSSLQVSRVGIVCRAVDNYIPCVGDDWMGKPVMKMDYNDFLDWNELETDARNLEYCAGDNNLVFRRDIDSVHLYKTVISQQETPYDDINMRRLPLKVIY